MFPTSIQFNDLQPKGQFHCHQQQLGHPGYKYLLQTCNCNASECDLLCMLQFSTMKLLFIQLF